MENAIDYGEVARRLAQRQAAIEEKFGNYVSTAPIFLVDSMRVVVEYTAFVGRVEYFTRGKGHFFTATTARQPPVSASSLKASLEAAMTNPELHKKLMELWQRRGEEWQNVDENAYVIRDEFFKIKTVGQALEFLQMTGEFSPLDRTITWREFQKWQRIARMVQEHNELAATMQSGKWNGEYTEVLMALSNYPSALFDDSTIEIDEFPDTTKKSLKRFSPEEEQQLHEAIEDGKQVMKQLRRELWKWFIKPPVSIEWQPNSKQAYEKILKRHIDPATGLGIPIVEESPILHGGAMIEFLLSQNQLVPVLDSYRFIRKQKYFNKFRQLRAVE